MRYRHLVYYPGLRRHINAWVSLVLSLFLLGRMEEKRRRETIKQINLSTPRRFPGPRRQDYLCDYMSTRCYRPQIFRTSVPEHAERLPLPASSSWVLTS